jgi:NhaP-type Na+/H+ or K+/H+ antiporter
LWLDGFSLKLQRHLADPLIESTASLIFPFGVYIIAQYVGVSGVLAVVAGGLVRGHYYPEILSARARIQGLATWDVVIFILNSLSFVLIGLQLHGILAWLIRYSVPTLIAGAFAISFVVIVSRILWVFAMAYLPRRASNPRPDFRAGDGLDRYARHRVVGHFASVAGPNLYWSAFPRSRSHSFLFVRGHSGHSGFTGIEPGAPYTMARFGRGFPNGERGSCGSA